MEVEVLEISEFDEKSRRGDHPGEVEKEEYCQGFRKKEGITGKNGWKAEHS